MKIRIRALISGRVQGVNFRFYTKVFVDRVGVTGWVRNLDDGRVEVVAEGGEEKINKLINYLHKGPILARVDNVEIIKEQYKGEFESFEIRF